MTARLFSYRPSRRVYASRSAGVLSNKIVTFGDSKGWAFWVTKLYCKLVSLRDYLRIGKKCSYILIIFFVFDTKMYKFLLDYWDSFVIPAILDILNSCAILAIRLCHYVTFYRVAVLVWLTSISRSRLYWSGPGGKARNSMCISLTRPTDLARS